MQYISRVLLTHHQTILNDLRSFLISVRIVYTIYVQQKKERMQKIIFCVIWKVFAAS